MDAAADADARTTRPQRPTGQRALKVLFLIDFVVGPVAGTERQLIDLIRGIDDAGLRPLLAVFRATPYVSDAAQLPVIARVLGIERLASLRTLFRLFRLTWFIRHERIDIVHIFFNDAALVAPLFCRLGGAKVIVARRDLGFWYTPANLALLRLSNRFVNLIVANSEAVRRSVSQREGYPAERIRVIYNGHDLRRFVRPPADDLRLRYNIPRPAPIVGIVANLNPVKRHRDLIDAFARVRERVTDAHLVLVGSGPLEPVLRDQVSALGLQNAVHFLGSMQDVIPVVRLFAVGVLCSESEGFSNALIEYMGCGVPSIATGVGGNAELIDDGLNGLLVEVGDSAALATAIESVLADPMLARRLGHAGRRTVEGLTLERMIDAHIRAYRAVGDRAPMSR